MQRADTTVVYIFNSLVQKKERFFNTDRPGLESCLEDVFLKGTPNSNGQVLPRLYTNIGFVNEFRSMGDDKPIVSMPNFPTLFHTSND